MVIFAYAMSHAHTCVYLIVISNNIGLVCRGQEEKMGEHSKNGFPRERIFRCKR